MSVHPLYRDSIANGAGHNAPRFQDDVDAVLRNGTLRVSLQRLQMGIDDPRLDRSHLRVLNYLTKHLNSEHAVCWPGRADIAKRARIEEKSVHNLLYQLRAWGYVTWERRPTKSLNDRVLLHYTFPIARHPIEQIQDEIEKAIGVIREKLNHTARPSGHTRSNGQSDCPPQQADDSACPNGHARPSGAETARPSGSSNLSMEPEEVVVVRAPDAVLVRVEEEPTKRLTDDVVGFIAQHARVDEQKARTMLADNTQIYGAANVADAYTVTVAAMATDIVARPYQFFLETARKKRDSPRQFADAQPARQRGPTSKSDIFDRYTRTE